MQKLNPDGVLIHRVVVATLVGGIALAFVLLQREPGWQPFATAGVLAWVSLLLALAPIPGSDPLGYLALAILMLGMFWEPGRPWSAITGVILTLLSALKNVRVERTEAEHAAADQPGGDFGAGPVG